MKKMYLLISLILIFFSFRIFPVQAQNGITDSLAGRILIQTEALGQAWYLNPIDLKRYYLARPADALLLMKRFGVGITNENLAKQTVINNNLGKIFLQVEARGQAWYFNPVDNKKYFLGRPDDAFNLMKKFGLGIKNSDLNQIPIGYLPVLLSPAPKTSTNTPITSQDIFYSAAQTIMSGDIDKSLAYFTPGYQALAKYTLNFLSAGGRFNLGNIMSGAKLTSSTSDKKEYSTDLSYLDYNFTVTFRVLKQADGKWLISNL